MKSQINGMSIPPNRNSIVLIIDAQQTENQDGKKSQIIGIFRYSQNFFNIYHTEKFLSRLFVWSEVLLIFCR